MNIEQDSPQVRLPPPLIALTFALLGFLLHQIYPVSIGNLASLWLFGSFLVGLGLVLIIYCAGVFRRRQTNIEPWKQTTAIISTGIYGLSRNPIYLSFFIIGIGLAFFFNTFWIILMQIPFLVVMNHYVIAREEAYLSGKFGQEYSDYKRKVRRWI